jgi:RNA polymerase sigma-70 factor (ECF subfamily)
MEDIIMSNTNIAVTTDIAAVENTPATNTTTTINLRDFYPWYTHDEFVEVPTVTAEELFADKRYHKAHDRRMKRNKSYSLDFEADMEKASIACHSDNPEYIFTMMERHCNLCQALNSLPDIQGRRIDAHYLQGKSRKEIAQAEGVSERAVNYSIESGLRAMKKYLSNNFQNRLLKCPQSDL